MQLESLQYLIKFHSLLVDPEDIEALSLQIYYITEYGYVLSRDAKQIHRIILNPKSNETIDHINGNKLDNRKSNLRICTQAENNRNRKVDDIKGYKGIRYTSGNYTVRVANDTIGTYSDLEAAKNSYNYFAAIKFGAFYKPNPVSKLMTLEEFEEYRTKRTRQGFQISYNKKHNRYHAYNEELGKMIYIGSYSSKEEAQGAIREEREIQ